MSDNEQIMPVRHSEEPTGTTAMMTFKVWSLDVWGHGSDECPCLEDKSDGDEDGCNSCGDFTVNDRCHVGQIEVECDGTRYNPGTEYEFISFHPSNDQFKKALVDGEYLKAEFEYEFDGEDEASVWVESAKDRRPLLQFEREHGGSR